MWSFKNGEHLDSLRDTVVVMQPDSAAVSSLMYVIRPQFNHLISAYCQPPSPHILSTRRKLTDAFLTASKRICSKSDISLTQWISANTPPMNNCEKARSIPGSAPQPQKTTSSLISSIDQDFCVKEKNKAALKKLVMLSLRHCPLLSKPIIQHLLLQIIFQ